MFQDGLTGFLCRKHFWEALKARSEQIDSKEKETSHADTGNRKVS